MNSERIVVNSNQIISDFGKNIKDIKTVNKQVEKDFVTPNGHIAFDNSNHGIVSDLKIEGNTLVNLGGRSNARFVQYKNFIDSKYLLKPSTLYTFVITNIADNIIKFYPNENVFLDSQVVTLQPKSTIAFTKITKNTVNELYLLKSRSDDNTLFNVNTILLEGDHTTNYPNYFEGLKSVGDDFALSVSSLSGDANILTKSNIFINSSHDSTQWLSTNGSLANTKSQMTFDINIDGGYYFFDNVDLDSVVDIQLINHNFTHFVSAIGCVNYLPQGKYGLRYKCNKGDNFLSHISICKSKGGLGKNVLFKNQNENYENVILRSLPNGIKDTIEKHSNGKYYYHKRCDEIILNGNADENFTLNNSMSVHKDVSLKFETQKFKDVIKSIDNELISNHVVSDKFKTSTDSLNHSEPEECITQTVAPFNSISIRISKSRLSTPDVNGLVKWLKSNNVVVVVALAQEEIYECVNLDLSSYEVKTSVICRSNITPLSMSFKTSSHISNVIDVVNDSMTSIENTVSNLINPNYTQSLKTNGYKILPGGLILQWGSYNTIPTQTYTAVGFQTPFPNACLNISITKRFVSDYNPLKCCVATSREKGWFNLYHPLSTQETVEWFAIGF